MTRLRPMVIRIAALAFALVSGRLFFTFGRGVEPQDSLLREVVAAALFGLAAHLGLFLSADAKSRHLWYRRLAFVLMLPTSLVLGASSLEAAQRLFAGNPMGTPVIFFYCAGLTAYIVQLVAVMRSGLSRKRRATAA